MTTLKSTRGWTVVAALFVTLVFTGGIGFYVFSVFVGPLSRELGWSITSISASVGLWAIAFGLSGPLVGAVIARIGPRYTLLAGAAFVALTTAGYACMSRMWMLYVLQFLFGCACASTIYIPAQTLVTNWFDRHRGRAMALTMMGVGAGGFLLPPLYEFLIRNFGWRLAFGFSSVAMVAVVAPVVGIFVRDFPGATLEKLSAPSEAAGLSMGRAVRTLNFRLLFGIYLFQLIGISVMNFHFIPFAAIQAGFSTQQAALFFGIALGFSVVGQFVSGWAADRFSPVVLQAATGLLMALGLCAVEIGVIWPHSHETTPLWFYAAGFGLGLGGQSVLLPLLVGKCFGARDFSRILGLMMGGFAAGVVIGIPLAGWSYDHYRTYEPAFVACIAAFVVSGLLAVFIRSDRNQADF